MANPSTMVDVRIPAQFEATTSPDTVLLDPNWIYELFHNGVDDAGNADTDEIMLGFSTSTTAKTAAAGSGAALGSLTTTKWMTIHGVKTLSFDASANNPHFTIVPIGHSQVF